MNLLGVPPILEFESPASWLSRAALSQGVDIKVFRKHINLHRNIDADLAFTKTYVRHISKVTGQEPQCFAFVQHMLTSLRRVDRHGQDYLLGHGPTARYRFCPVCLSKDRVKTFPLHWRFKAWRWCPLHSCMMRDGCPHCLSWIHLPGAMLAAGAKKEGVAFLDRCLKCGEPLTTDWQRAHNSLDPSLLAPWEETVMDNGRAVLSALFHRYIYVDGVGERFSLNGLKRFQRRGLLPHENFSLTHDEVVRRRERQLALVRKSPLVPR